MPLQHPVIDFDWLASVHEGKRLQLTTSVGLSGLVHMNGSSTDLVSELIRLARLGQTAERKELGL